MKSPWDFPDIALELGIPYLYFCHHLTSDRKDDMDAGKNKTKQVFKALSGTSLVQDYLTDFMAFDCVKVWIGKEVQEDIAGKQDY